MFDELRQRVAGENVLLLGVGNRLRGDDGVGSLLIERLQGRVSVPLIDVSDVPENYLGPIENAQADLILIVDAANLHAAPGEAAILELDQLRHFSVSTHTADLSLFIRVIPKERRPAGLLVGIQPESTEAGRGLSEAVESAMKGLEAIFLKLFPK